MKLIFYAALIAAVAALYSEKTLLGRWESRPSAAGNVTGVVFRPDHTYMAYTNRKPFASGIYSLRDSLLIIKEKGCEHAGTYKTIFFAGGDSLKLQPQTDSCTERAKGIAKLVFGRVN